MRILQICFRMPFPLKDGGAIAMYNMTKSFFELGHKTVILAPLTKKHCVDIEKLPDFFQKLASIYTININSEITIWGAIKNLFSNKPYYISRYESRAFEQKLIQILIENEFEIIHIESLKVSMYVDTIRKFSNAKIVLRSHNIEFKIWERTADSARIGMKKWYLNILVKRLKKYEINCLNKFDAIAPITKVDAEFFKDAGCVKPMFITASGIDFQRFKPIDTETEVNSFFHLGALDWMPNLEAVNWFLSAVWPQITEKFPDLIFYLAGRNMPESILKLKKKNVIILGEIKDAIEFMNTKRIMIVPLLSGSGMRIKIIEGMALGKIIISTSIGAEGIEYTPDENILIANTPNEFLHAIEKIKNNQKFATNISTNAIKLVKSNYDNNVIVGNLLDNYKNLVLEK